MITDDVTISVRAGRGGNGVVRFARTMMAQGPTGGNGGRGGDVVAVGVSDLGALRAFRTQRTIRAGNGGDGEQNMRDGANGKTAIIRVPVGSVITDERSGDTYDITEVDQRVVIARGGRGGLGNYHFRSGRNTSPQRATPGTEGYSTTVRVRLKMIADIGFIGLPNVGKSSLLNALTNANSKVANYHFTTLQPHLGVYYGIILADIPGLIAGAADGKGLGHKFLQHIERTRTLLHVVAADSADPLADYLTVRAELGRYNSALLKTPEWVVVSRSDERSVEDVERTVELLSQENPRVLAISLLDDESILRLRREVLDPMTR